MSWLSQHLEHVKKWTNAYQQQRVFEAALKRDRVRNAEFWANIGEHLSSGPSTTLNNNVVEAFHDFLSTLEVPLKDNPDSALLGSPLLQLYFGYSGLNGMKDMKFVYKWDVEHKILALALNAGLPVTPGLSTMFVSCCEHQTEFMNLSLTGDGKRKSKFISMPDKRPAHTYPHALNLPQVYLRKLFSNNPKQERCLRPIGALSDKFLAGAQLLEVFGADWNQSPNGGKTLGARLFEQLGKPEEFEKYSSPELEVNVEDIIAQKKRDKKVEISNSPRLKL